MSLLVFTQACPQAASGAGQVQAPFVHVWVWPQAGMHCPELPPIAGDPPLPSPPLPALVVLLPPLG
jgi:hypothetical protein